jgi:hypothetical protein
MTRLVLGGYLLDAYREAENFSKLLQQRVRGAGFFKTLLLRRLGSSMEAGRNTVIGKLLGQRLTSNDKTKTTTTSMTKRWRRNRQSSRHTSEFKNFTKPKKPLRCAVAWQLLNARRQQRPQARCDCRLSTGHTTT